MYKLGLNFISNLFFFDCIGRLAKIMFHLFGLGTTLYIAFSILIICFLLSALNYLKGIK